MLQARGADPRLYNPDRDLLWAMPRLISTALKMMGRDITTDQVRSMLLDRMIACPVPDERLREELESFILDMARFLNDMKDNATARKNPQSWFDALFSSGPRAAIRALVADLLFCAMFAEMPLWFASVQPDKANSPLPDVEKVQREVESILRGRVGGAGASNE